MSVYETITRKYYAELLDCDEQDLVRGIRYVRSPKRDIQLHGYSSTYTLCLCKTDAAVVISYSPKVQKQIEQMKTDFSMMGSFDSNLNDYLNKLFPAKVEHNIKFVFERQTAFSNENVISLSKDDYPVFLKFRLSLGSNVWDSMRAYFEKICESGYCLARMVDGVPVSVTDAPSMPFMQDEAQEIGVNTLPYYRRRGYAEEVVSACISRIISEHKCPLWSCNADNHASERLAYSLGFKKFCDLLFGYLMKNRLSD